MGRTIPSFRNAAILEEKEWKQYKKYLNNKNDKKAFSEMFAIARLYNFACSYASIPIRIYPIMMSIVFHHYKILKERLNLNLDSTNEYAIYNNNNSNSTLLLNELEK